MNCVRNFHTCLSSSAYLKLSHILINTLCVSSVYDDDDDDDDDGIHIIYLMKHLYYLNKVLAQIIRNHEFKLWTIHHVTFSAETLQI